eukprot:1729836-Prymnesium_polylepis.2
MGARSVKKVDRPQNPWWETIELLRKVGLVLVLLFAEERILGVFVMASVAAASLAARPLTKATYHIYNATELAVEVSIMLLGVLVATRHRSGTLSGVLVDEPYSPNGHPGDEQYFAIAFFACDRSRSGSLLHM